MLRRTRFEVVEDAIDVILRRLDGLPPSDTTARLRAEVHECIREAGQWTASQLSDTQRDALMKHVLALHTEVAAMERSRVSSDSGSRNGAAEAS